MGLNEKSRVPFTAEEKMELHLHLDNILDWFEKGEVDGYVLAVLKGEEINVSGQLSLETMETIGKFLVKKANAVTTDFLKAMVEDILDEEFEEEEE